jgi:predicted Abi (CAAX) family protease
MTGMAEKHDSTRYNQDFRAQRRCDKIAWHPVASGQEVGHFANSGRVLIYDPVRRGLKTYLEYQTAFAKKQLNATKPKKFWGKYFGHQRVPAIYIEVINQVFFSLAAIKNF